MACHPRLPLVACWDAERPAVHIWSCGTGELRELGSVGAASDAYGDAIGRDRTTRTPAVAWHPDQPLLVVAGEDGVVRWTPAGTYALEGVPAMSAYRYLAFGPDGGSLWASPSSDGEGDAWDSSDVLDLASGTISSAVWWDTGVAEHPGGGLVATLASDQGETLCLFARVDQADTPAAMRLLSRALILDCDGYETPLFSPDGRHLVIRGNAYDNSLEVFGFPSLHQVLATALGEPSPGYPSPPEWLDQMRAWSRHNLAFSSRSDALWVGTPAGTLVEVDFETQQAAEHAVLKDSRVTALAATAAGALLVAGGGGELALLTVLDGSAPAPGAVGDHAVAAATAFLEAADEIPDDGDLETHLVMTDGTRVWEPGDLTTVTTAAPADPTWLRLRAAVNEMQGQNL
ncbi:hypothetical protein CF54_16190 [Streptomyces sp. Tu 6176]|nr:hypothetical protein CF54_16190 [Streptomyces sp. Tu 6176]